MVHRRTSPPPMADTFLNLGPQRIVNREAALAACRIDAPADRLWLLRNPRKERRKRAASPRERAAFGLSKDAMVIVKRLENGAQARVFVEPKSEAATSTKK